MPSPLRIKRISYPASDNHATSQLEFSQYSKTKSQICFRINLGKLRLKWTGNDSYIPRCGGGNRPNHNFEGRDYLVGKIFFLEIWIDSAQSWIVKSWKVSWKSFLKGFLAYRLHLLHSGWWSQLLQVTNWQSHIIAITQSPSHNHNHRITITQSQSHNHNHNHESQSKEASWLLAFTTKPNSRE